MSKSNRIIDNLSCAEWIEQLQVFGSLESIYRELPFARKLFPNLGDAFAKLSEIKKQAEILQMPDRFNEIFSPYGWIAYESMNLEVIREAINHYEASGIEKAELYLAETYDEETLRFRIKQFNGNSEFRRRIRLVSLAKDDYLAERYHACIPLLLSILDGVVNDVSRHVGFFAESVDMTAWDSIAAHETGLQSIAS